MAEQRSCKAKVRSSILLSGSTSAPDIRRLDVMTPNTAPEHAALIERLQTRRVELTAKLAALTEPPDPTAAISFGKRVGDGTTEAVERISSTLTARSISSSLDEVDRALEKVDAGTFGVCDICGEPIPTARLEARPFTARCVAHADLPAPDA